jgi:hypothetical protein
MVASAHAQAMYDGIGMSLTGEQRSVLIGSLLGDGSMRCKTNALLEINHALAQRAYVDWKYRVFADLVRTPPAARDSNGDRKAYRFVTRSLEALTPYYRAFYPSGRKTVPEFELTDLALAVWFMDDGCRSRSSIYLNTQQFTVAEQLRLIDHLDRQFGLKTTLNRDRSYVRLRLRVSSVPSFREIVGPHLLPELAYKLPD